MKKTKKKPPAFQILAEARALREDLGAGLSVAEICAKRGWGAWTYQRRMRVARKMAEQEYNPERSFDIFIRYEARYRAFQAQAESLARVLDNYLGKYIDSPLASKIATVAHARAAVSRLIADWEDRIIATAQRLGVIPSAPPEREDGGKERWTFAEFARAAIVERESSTEPRRALSEVPD
jgi:hypothetical protein